MHNLDNVLPGARAVSLKSVLSPEIVWQLPVCHSHLCSEEMGKETPRPSLCPELGGGGGVPE